MRFKRSDKLLVRDRCDGNWVERIVLHIEEKAYFPYLCVASGEEDKFISGESFATTEFKYAKPLPQTKKVSMDEVRELLKEKYGDEVTIELED